MPTADTNRKRLQQAPNPLLQELTRPWAPPTGSTVIAAVSGGADSVAMGLLLAALAPGQGWRVELATLDHGLRGEAGARDRAFVESLARSQGLVCHSRRAGLATTDATPGGSAEMAARQARRDFLLDLAKRADAVVALAHTREDQAETLLYRLTRGSGLLGAGAMRRWHPPLWRPLLAVSGAELRALLSRWEQPWVEDETNRDRSAASRNRIRLDVLPELDRAVGGHAAAGLARAAALAAEDEELLAELAAARMRDVPLERAPGRAALDRREMLSVEPPLRRRIVRDLLIELGGGSWRPTAAHLLAVDQLVEARSHGTSVDLPEGFTAVRREGWIVLSAGRQNAGPDLDK